MFLGPCTFTKDFKLTVQSVHLIKDILLILKYFWNCGHFLILICCNKYFSKWQNGDNYLNKFHYSESIHTFFLKTVHGHIKLNIVAEPAPKTQFSGIRVPEIRLAKNEEMPCSTCNKIPFFCCFWVLKNPTLGTQSITNRH